jgi:hypothetical protein
LFQTSNCILQFRFSFDLYLAFRGRWFRDDVQFPACRLQYNPFLALRDFVRLSLLPSDSRRRVRNSTKERDQKECRCEIKAKRRSSNAVADQVLDSGARLL